MRELGAEKNMIRLVGVVFGTIRPLQEKEYKLNRRSFCDIYRLVTRDPASLKEGFSASGTQYIREVKREELEELYMKNSWSLYGKDEFQIIMHNKEKGTQLIGTNSSLLAIKYSMDQADRMDYRKEITAEEVRLFSKKNLYQNNLIQTLFL